MRKYILVTALTLFGVSASSQTKDEMTKLVVGSGSVCPQTCDKFEIPAKSTISMTVYWDGTAGKTLWVQKSDFGTIYELKYKSGTPVNDVPNFFKNDTDLPMKILIRCDWSKKDKHGDCWGKFYNDAAKKKLFIAFDDTNSGNKSYQDYKDCLVVLSWQ